MALGQAPGDRGELSCRGVQQPRLPVLDNFGLPGLANQLRQLANRQISSGPTVLDEAGGFVVAAGRSQPLATDPRFDAGAELVRTGPGESAQLHGWAYGPTGEPRPEVVLVFIGSQLVGPIWPEQPSRDVFLRQGNEDVRALVSGFALWFDPGRFDLDAPVTVVSLRSDQALAAELPALTETTHDGASR